MVELLYQRYGVRVVLMPSDEDLIDQVMANRGYRRQEAIDRLWAFGGI